jgi:outer membrane protein
MQVATTDNDGSGIGNSFVSTSSVCGFGTATVQVMCVNKLKMLRIFNSMRLLALLLVLSLWTAPDLVAAESERFMVRGGPVWIKSDTETVVKLNGVPLPGSSMGVEDKWHGGFILTMPVYRNFSLETMISTPATFDITAKGGLLGNEFRAAQIDPLPLILIGRYTPEWDWYGVRPFAGIGAVYVLFDNAKITSTFEALGASLGLHDPAIDVDEQLRPVVELGIDYLMGERWFLNATWLYFDGEDKITVTYSNGAQLGADVSYKPQFFAMTMGYRF